MAHLFVDVSSHGLGHLAQVAPVLKRLRQIRPTLRLTVRSGLARERLARRLNGEFQHIAEASDFGFVMANALDIDLAASADRYRQFHADWSARIAGEASLLKDQAPDLVLADVAYLPLAGAAAAGLPAIALCSLHWADLFGHYFGAEPWAAPIEAEIRAAYRSADAFLRATPGMAMADLANRLTIGPVAATPSRSRAQVAAALGLPADRRWVLVALGGFDFPLPVTAWPRRPDIVWISPSAQAGSREDVFALDDGRLPFTDLLAAADALVTKPGYGSFTEATVNGVPLLYLRRPDWPEEACLIEWLHRHGRAREISRPQAVAGDLLPALDALWQQPAPPPPRPTGIDEAVDQLLRRLPGGC